MLDDTKQAFSFLLIETTDQENTIYGINNIKICVHVSLTMMSVIHDVCHFFFQNYITSQENIRSVLIIFGKSWISIYWGENDWNLPKVDSVSSEKNTSIDFLIKRGSRRPKRNLVVPIKRNLALNGFNEILVFDRA